jgi:hypothetical protein
MVRSRDKMKKPLFVREITRRAGRLLPETLILTHSVTQWILQPIWNFIARPVVGLSRPAIVGGNGGSLSS